MSRHVIVNDGSHEVVVGWDSPLGAYFAQVYRAGGDELADDDWLLSSSSLDGLAGWLEARGFALPDDIRERLQADRDAPWTPGPLQRALGFTGGPT